MTKGKRSTKARSAADAGLRPAWRVGFSGHRKLPDVALIRTRLGEVWRELAGRVEGTLEGCVGAAEGADLIFAQTCLDAGAPLHLVLPYGLTYFAPEVGPEWRERFERATAAAATITAVSDPAEGDSAYYAGGIATLEASDVLVVVWNGQPAAGLGGTGDILGAARERGLPWVWIHSKTGEVDWSGLPKDRLVDPLTGDLAELLRHVPGTGDGSTAELFARLDQAANQSAPRFRGIASANLQLHAVAIAVAAISMKVTIPALLAGAAWVKVGILALTVALFFYAKYRDLHHSWLLCRTGAELLRSLRVAGAFYGLREFDIVLEGFPSFRRLVRPCLTETAELRRTIPLAERAATYEQERLAPQEAYFARSVARLEKAHHRIDRAFMVFSLGGLAAAVGYLIFAGAVLAIGAIVLPVLAMTVLALNSSLDIDRRLARYRDMQRVLHEARQQLARAKDSYHIKQVVRATERQLLQEIGEWYQRTRHLHIH